MSEKNDINAIRLSLVKAISATPYQKGSKCENIKNVAIDVPCAPNIFVQNFVSKGPFFNYAGEENYKCTVSPSDLQKVFGKDWDTFVYQGSNTIGRIIGLIVVHYRRKEIPISFNCNDARYIKFHTLDNTVHVQ